MKKFLILLVAILSLSSTKNANAQTPTHNVIWNYVGANAAEVATYTQAVFVDNVRVIGNPVCVGTTATDTRCSIGVGQLAAGPHTVAVEATKDNITTRTQVTNLNIGANAPKNPSGFSYQINVTISLP